MTRTTDIDANDPYAELRDWQLGTLKELAELGMALARDLPAQAEAARKADRPAAAPDPVLAFGRIARAIRLTVALQTRIIEGPPDPGRPAREAKAATEAAAELEDRRDTGRLRRAMTRFIAGTAVEAQEREAAEAENLFAALDVRLYGDGQDDADYAEIEVKALAYEICLDLGVDPGPTWWEESWGISPPPKRCFGGGGPPNGGGGGRLHAVAKKVPVPD